MRWPNRIELIANTKTFTLKYPDRFWDQFLPPTYHIHSVKHVKKKNCVSEPSKGLQSPLR